MAWKPPEEELKKRESEVGPVGRYMPRADELPGLAKKKASDVANTAKKITEIGVWGIKETPKFIKKISVSERQRRKR